MAENEVFLELDERGRAALRAHGAKPRARYLATFRADGSILLTPAVVMTEAQWKASQPDQNGGA